MSRHYGSVSRGLVVLKRYKPHGDAPRDFRSYDGRGASKALLLACARVDHIDQWPRAITLELMALDQVEREQARDAKEREAS